MLKPTMVLGVFVCLAGCAGETGITGTPDSEAADVMSDTGILDTTPEEDTLVIDDAATTPCEVGAGCFGESCQDPDDCISSICTHHKGDKVCSKTCDWNSPWGYFTV